MSKFLAPIHTWLFNKILILEDIEKKIVDSVDNDELKLVHKKLQDSIGEFIPAKPLEELIDESNIHGWLQERISIAEIRQANYIHKLMETSSMTVEGISNIYEQAGEETAKGINEIVGDPSEAFKLLGDVLLEGMPCDRVNKVIAQQENEIIWLTTTCVHKNNWEQAGVTVENYYRFREAFTRGFVTTLNPKMSYTYTFKNQQEHKITI